MDLLNALLAFTGPVALVAFVHWGRPIRLRLAKA